MTVTGGGDAPLKSVFIRNSNNILFLSKADRNRWARTAIENTAYYWIQNYLKLRFNRAYATSVLGYHYGGRKPFYESGELQELALSGAHATGKISAIGPTANIVIPVPPYVMLNPKVVAGLKTLPLIEILRLAKVFESELQLGMDAAGTKTFTKGVKAGQTFRTFKKETKGKVLANNMLRHQLYRNQKLRGQNFWRNSKTG